ncbi:autotransporter-associated beta strand repeat-containing protein [Devosia nitrariae]|uniref:Autotransporter-associated beta strand protein n=1 Tax=Devosia nitrariae TaxID=2071872 RepID=A0ABQ5W750_9HYPH|nr:autotransporter-associated beta strand repeat-containing protein [Devosia nitrariae]GLQ55435.1 hypothetical protein GCM10010862_26940 [Devosia nitrariae]
MIYRLGHPAALGLLQRRRGARAALLLGASSVALIAAGASVLAEDKSLSGTLWDAPVNWSTGTLPDADDRAIFATTLSGIRNPQGPVGQMQFTSAAAGISFANPFSTNLPIQTLHGIGGVGIDQQASYVVSLYGRIDLGASQTWQASNVAGGGFQTTAGVFPVANFIGLGANTLTIDLVNNTNTASLSQIKGSGDLILTGLGTLTLTSNLNSYTGNTLIQSGTLALAGAATIASSGKVVVDGMFDVSGLTGTDTSIQSLAGSGLVNLGAKTLTIADAADEFSGVIEGAGALAVSGGTVVLSGANTYQGGANLLGGVLSVAADGNLGDGGDITFDGGTLHNSAAFASSRDVTINAGGGTFQTDADLALSGAITGTGALTKSGSGKLTLTGENPLTVI